MVQSNLANYFIRLDHFCAIFHHSMLIYKILNSSHLHFCLAGNTRILNASPVDEGKFYASFLNSKAAY